MSVVPRMLEKMATRMCQHYGCSPEEQREMLEGMREGAGIAPASAERSK
jgi:Rieske Fe-S protein